VAFLGPVGRASFAFHLSDGIGAADSGSRPVLPEAQQLTGVTLLSSYGKGEDRSLCPRLDPAHVDVVARDCGHHFAGDYRAWPKRSCAGLGEQPHFRRPSSVRRSS